MINSKNGPLVKTCYTIFDAQGQEASLTMWGETMAEVAQRWSPGVTSKALSFLCRFSFEPVILALHGSVRRVNDVSPSIHLCCCQLALVITGAQASMYSMKPQITIGYQTHIQVDPICKNIEVLTHPTRRSRMFTT